MLGATDRFSRGLGVQPSKWQTTTDFSAELAAVDVSGLSCHQIMAGVAAAATSVLGKPSKAQGKPTVREQEKKLVFKGYLQSALEPTW